MGELLPFPSRDRATEAPSGVRPDGLRPIATAAGHEAASAVRPEDLRWHILDQVELPGEASVDGRPQRGVIERLMLDGIAGMFWIRLTGGPRGGSVLVVDSSRIRRPATGALPLSLG